MNLNEFFIKKDKTINKIIDVYCNDDQRDWIVGFSGGKDSTVLVQIILESLIKIKEKFKNFSIWNKKIYILSSDTLIENFIVLKQINKSLDLIDIFVKKHNLPIVVKKIKPNLEDGFWVNLIGRGYPLPNQTFRWCTDRLKIKPMQNEQNDITKKTRKNFLTVLGIRKGESISRDIKMNKNKLNQAFFQKNSTNKSIIFSPIENFTLLDVWRYIQNSNSFFKENNKILEVLYEDSSYNVNECPSALDEDLKKLCGGSRWGCWICPVVQDDKSMKGFINSGATWLQDFLNFRNELILERDWRINRYKASFRINKKNSKVTFIKYKLMRLRKTKSGNLEIPKKTGRQKFEFIISETNSYHGSDGEDYQVIKFEEYKEKIDFNLYNPYSDDQKYYLIEKNGEIYTQGIGPYTLEYRKKILEKIIVLQKKHSDLQIISNEEVTLIKNIHQLLISKLIIENERWGKNDDTREIANTQK